MPPDLKLPKKKLVPELSDTIEVSGQRLARVRRVSKEEAPPPPFEEVVRQHLGDEARQIIEDNLDILKELAEEAPAPPLDLDLPRRIELFSDTSAIPSDESDPGKRDGVSISPIESAPDDPDFLVGHEPPQTLFDLFSLFPKLDGDNWFVHVSRKRPKTYSGVACSGVLHPITRVITLEEWQSFYGGGEYELIVYGPPKNGISMDASGRYQPRAKTRPIIVHFPGAPSLDSMVYSSEEESDMPVEMPIHGRGPRTIADATIRKAELDSQDKNVERAEQRAKEERDKAEALLREKAEAQGGTVTQIASLVAQMTKMQEEFRKDQLAAEREHRRELQAERDRLEEKFEELKRNQPRDGAPLEQVIALTKNFAPDPAATQREIDRMAAQHRSDLERAELRIREANERADRLIADSERRASERVKEVERRAQDAETQAKERADRMVKDAQADAERRLAEMHRQTETRISDLDRNHQRDLQSLRDTHAMALQTLTSTGDMRLEQQRAEVKRLAAEAERYRVEAAENKDFLGKMAEFKEQAAALGLVDASEVGNEPEDWKVTILKMVSGVAGNLPGIVESFGGAMKARSGQALEAAREQGRRDMIERAQSPMFPEQIPSGHRRRAPAVFGGEPLRHMSEVTAEPILPGQNRYQVPAPPPVMTVPPLTEPEVQVQHYVEPVGAAPPVATPSMIPPASSASVPPSAPAVSPEELARDRDILQGEPLIRAQYEQGITAKAMIDQLLSNVTLEDARGLLQSMVSAERVIEAVERSGDPASPFKRREGKKFLRDIFSELAKRVG